MATKKNTDATEALSKLTYLAGALKAPRITGSRPTTPVTPGGHTRSTSPRSSTARSPPGTRQVPSCGSVPPGSGRERPSRSSTGTPNPQPANRSPPSHRAGSSPKPGTSCCSAPGTGKIHLATGLGIAAAHHGHRVLFATATERVTRLTDAHRAGRLPKSSPAAALRAHHRRRVGYLPFEQDAANLFFQLVSSRYEHASLILTSNLPFSGWGGVFGDQAVAAAMIDRVVHHADVLTLKGATTGYATAGSTPCPASEPKTRQLDGME